MINMQMHEHAPDFPRNKRFFRRNMPNYTACPEQPNWNIVNKDYGLYIPDFYMQDIVEQKLDLHFSGWF